MEGREREIKSFKTCVLRPSPAIFVLCKLGQGTSLASGDPQLGNKVISLDEHQSPIKGRFSKAVVLQGKWLQARSLVSGCLALRSDIPTYQLGVLGQVSQPL